MIKERVHNKTEMLALLKEAANASDNKYADTEWFTHDGEYLGKTRLLTYTGAETLYQIIEQEIKQ